MVRELQVHQLVARPLKSKANVTNASLVKSLAWSDSSVLKDSESKIKFNNLSTFPHVSVQYRVRSCQSQLLLGRREQLKSMDRGLALVPWEKAIDKKTLLLTTQRSLSLKDRQKRKLLTLSHVIINN